MPVLGDDSDCTERGSRPQDRSDIVRIGDLVEHQQHRLFVRAREDIVQPDVLERLNLDSTFAQRSVNEGFSGGEKKRHEIAQLELLDPKVAVLDETDSGLDIDALKIVSEGVNRFREREGKGVLLITHYTRILRYIEPDHVHVFVDGKVAESGGKELAEELEASGYDKYLRAAKA